MLVGVSAGPAPLASLARVSRSCSRLTLRRWLLFRVWLSESNWVIRLVDWSEVERPADWLEDDRLLPAAGKGRSGSISADDRRRREKPTPYASQDRSITDTSSGLRVASLRALDRFRSIGDWVPRFDSRCCRLQRLHPSRRSLPPSRRPPPSRSLRSTDRDRG